MPGLLQKLSLLLLVAGVSCGSPLVKGWREDPEVQAMTPEERCNRQDGKTWVNGVCLASQDVSPADLVDRATCEKHQGFGWVGGKCVAFAELTENECHETSASESTGTANSATATWKWGKRPDGSTGCLLAVEADCNADLTKVFAGGACLTRPTVAAQGLVQQTLSAGQNMAEISITPSPGATLKLQELGSCPKFFKLEGGKLTSEPAPVPSSDATTCTANIVATKDAATSLPLTVEIKVQAGFLGLCSQIAKDPDLQRREPELALTVGLLKQAAGGKTDCSEAAKALSDITKLELPNSHISDVKAFSGLQKLQYLDLRLNPITDVSALQSMPNLEVLLLSPNAQLKDVNRCPTGDQANQGVRVACTLLKQDRVKP